MKTKEQYSDLQSFARTVRQQEILQAIIENDGNLTKAAKSLDVHPSTVNASIRRIEGYAVMQSYVPEVGLTVKTPSPLALKKLSNHEKLDPESGEMVVDSRWVQYEPKAVDQMEALREFTEGLADTIKGIAKPVKWDRKSVLDNMLTVYPLADVHLGMLSWAAETGNDYDTDIASNLIRVAADILTAKTEPSKYAIVANLGDFFHFDNDLKRTSASGHALDGDGRWQKVVRLGVEGLKYWIQKALEKHEHVEVINSIGNHDDQSALMLPLILEPYYSNEPRVTINTSPTFYHYKRFGSNLLGFHHGHKTPANRLPGAMTADCLLSADFESEGVEFCHWLTGHIHHESKEYDYGCLVESFRTLCAKDIYAAGSGYRALRDIQAVMYDFDYGECDRSRVSHKLIKAVMRGQI